MELRQRTRRFGGRVILCALILRLLAGGLPAKVASWLTGPKAVRLLILLETGRDVRFSASSPDAQLHTAESPGPMIEQTLPVFDREEKVAVSYSCDLRPDLEELVAQPLQWDLTGEAPAVLIFHTHTTESYTGEGYTESGEYRTLEEEYNMLSIGEEVAKVLEEHGICVIHDRTVHDYPNYNGAYNHARRTVLGLLEEYPTIRLVLDLHRDALESGHRQLSTEALANGVASAQLMLVMGTDAGGLEHGTWEENLSLALKLQLQLERRNPGITRPISLRSQRFNQDLSPGALLVEVGAAGNTREEALVAARELALAIADLSRGTGTD